MFVETLQSITGLNVLELIQINKGGVSQQQGTWVHPRIATHLAMWISPKFAAHVTGWIEEWKATSAQNNAVWET